MVSDRPYFSEKKSFLGKNSQPKTVNIIQKEKQKVNLDINDDLLDKLWNKKNCQLVITLFAAPIPLVSIDLINEAK